MKNENLSAEQISILKQIANRGLRIIWSFKRPTETWLNTEEELTTDESRILNSMMTLELVEHTIPTITTTNVIVTTLKGYLMTIETFVEDGTGKRHLVSSEVKPQYIDHGDKPIVSEVVQNETEYEHLQQWVIKSTYIDRRKIPADDWTEENIGLTFEYFLNDEGKRIITN